MQTWLTVRLKRREMAAKKYPFVTIPISPQRGEVPLQGGEKAANQSTGEGCTGVRDIQQTGTGLELPQGTVPACEAWAVRRTPVASCKRRTHVGAVSGTKTGGSKLPLQALASVTSHVFPKAAQPQLLCYEKHHCRANSLHIHHLP